MKYLKLLKKYLFVFVGAVLFGMAAIKVKSAQRSENKMSQKLRELAEAGIDDQDKIIAKNVNDLRKAQAHASKVKKNAIKKLDNISSNSESVGSLLNDYNRDRV